MKVSMTVNGEKNSNDVEPRLLLVHYIREVLGLTGAHIGCETTQCGACTIMVNGQSVKSCTMLAVQADGADILTIEGMQKNGQMHPIQEGFWEEPRLQCGYCTPGMIMSTLQLLERNPNPSEAEIREGLQGNLCRCTGYHNIVKSVQYAAAHMKEGGKRTEGTGRDILLFAPRSTPGERNDRWYSRNWWASASNGAKTPISGRYEHLR